MFADRSRVLPRDHRAPNPSGPPSYRRVTLAPASEPDAGVFASVFDAALRAFVDDAMLSVLEVCAVEPELDGLCLRLVLRPRRESVYFGTGEALARLHAARPMLRAAFAAAIGQDVAPDLLFEVRSWR